MQLSELFFVRDIGWLQKCFTVVVVYGKRQIVILLKVDDDDRIFVSPVLAEILIESSVNPPVHVDHLIQQPSAVGGKW